MKDIILCHPVLLLYVLLYVATMFLAFWPRPSNLPPREGDGRRCVPELDSRFWQVQIGREWLCVRELREYCAAEYATRYSSAIKRIRQK